MMLCNVTRGSIKRTNIISSFLPVLLDIHSSPFSTSCKSQHNNPSIYQTPQLFTPLPSLLCNARKPIEETNHISSFLLVLLDTLLFSPLSASCKTLTPPPPPPVPEKIPFDVSAHGKTWQDPYHWMNEKDNPDFIRYLRRENKYADAFMDDTKNLQHTFYSEMTARLPSYKFDSPPRLSGPWFYYAYTPKGKRYPIYCRKLATDQKKGWFRTANNHATGESPEVQILLDYNELVKQYGYVDVGEREVSPNHNYLAYTLDITGAEEFMLQIKNLNTGILEKFRADDVYQLVWAQDNCTLFYTTNRGRFRLQCCTPEQNPIKNIKIYTATQPSFNVDITSTKDKNYITVNSYSDASSEVYYIDANNVKSGLHRIQKRICGVQYRLEHHHHGFFYALTDQPLTGDDQLLATGKRYVVRCPVQHVNETRWETVLVPGEDTSIKDIDIFNEHLVLDLERNGLSVPCSIKFPINGSFKKGRKIDDLNPWYFPLPSNLCTIVPGSNYDFMSSQYRVIVSSPVMSDVSVNYDMSRHTFSIIDPDEVVGNTAEFNSGSIIHKKNRSELVNTRSEKGDDVIHTEWLRWSDFSDAYCCEKKDVVSHDGVRIPLTILYSRKAHQKAQSLGLLKGYGAYGTVLDKSWSSYRQSLLDRGWVVAFADVRGGGIGGGTDSSWHKSGRGLNKLNSIADFVSCAEYLISEGYVHKNQLGASGCSAGGLLVGAAANRYPELFRAIILEVPFLDVCNTLVDPYLSSSYDHKEFGNPKRDSQFLKIFKYSPYDNVPKGVCCPAMLVKASFNDTRVGVWEPAKWVAKVREIACSECSKAVILITNMKCGHIGEPWGSGIRKEIAYEYAFLVKAMGLMDEEDRK